MTVRRRLQTLRRRSGQKVVRRRPFGSGSQPPDPTLSPIQEGSPNVSISSKLEPDLSNELPLHTLSGAASLPVTERAFATSSPLPLEESTHAVHAHQSIGTRSTRAKVGVVTRVLMLIKAFAMTLIYPPTAALLFAIVVALVKPLKALFVHVEGYQGIPNAPDGQPPLHIVIDTCIFVGACTIPLGLIILGVSMANMKIPRPFSRLPLSSIILLAIAKLIISPVLGVLFVQVSFQQYVTPYKLTFAIGLGVPRSSCRGEQAVALRLDNAQVSTS